MAGSMLFKSLLLEKRCYATGVYKLCVWDQILAVVTLQGLRNRRLWSDGPRTARLEVVLIVVMMVVDAESESARKDFFF